VEPGTEADLPILQDRVGIGANVIRPDLAVHPQLFVPSEFVFDAAKHRFIVGLRQALMARIRRDVVGKVLEQLDHDVLLNDVRSPARQGLLARHPGVEAKVTTAAG
jgi:hypothetical protein